MCNAQGHRALSKTILQKGNLIVISQQTLSIGRINISLQTFTAITMPCYYKDFLSLDQIRHKGGLFNYIYTHC